jgi:RNA polymerase sigma-70 factor (ECF subfamily)
VFRIANNRLIDHYRISKRETTVEEIPEIDANVSISEMAHSKLLYKEIEGLLENFSEQERDILLLKLSSGLKFSEIAQILGLNENTVKTKYFRSLKNLQGRAQYLKLLALFVLLASQ